MIIDLAGALPSVCFPPYGDVRVWRASCRMFTKYFNPSNSSIDQPSEVKYVRRFFGCHRSTFKRNPAISFSACPDVRPRFLIPCQHLFLYWSCRFYRTIDDTQLQRSTPKLYRDYRRSGLFYCRALDSSCFPCGYYSHLEVYSRMVPGAKFQIKAALMRKHAAKKCTILRSQRQRN